MALDRRLAAVLAAAFLMRAAMAAWVGLWSPTPAGFHTFDTPSYLAPAAELALAGTFTVDGIPDIHRTPGYCLLLVPGFWLGHPEYWAIALNLLLAVGTALAVARLADRVFGHPGASVAAAGLYAADPLSIFHTAQVASETAFTFCIAWCLVLLASYLQEKDRGPRRLLLAGLVLAAATLIRPISLYLPWLLAALLAAALLPGEVRRLRRAAHLALFLAVSAGPPHAWQLRNLLAAGYNGLSVIVAVNAYYFQAAAVQARQEGKSMMRKRMELGYERELHLLAHPRERKEDPARHFEGIHREARKVLRKHWPVYAAIHAQGILKVLTNPGASGYLVVHNRYAEVEAVAGVYPEGGAWQVLGDFRKMRPAFLIANLGLGLLLIGYYVLAARGFLRRRLAWTAGLSLIVLVGAYFILVSGGANSVSRFRHPVMPLLCLFAGVGLVRGGKPAGDSIPPVPK